MSSSKCRPGRVVKFSELAHRWWDPDEFRPAPNPIIAARMDQSAVIPRPRGRNIDVGCGGGSCRTPWPQRGRGDGHRLGEQGVRVARLHALEAQTPRVNTVKSALRNWRRNRLGHSIPSPAWKCSSTCPTPVRGHGLCPSRQAWRRVFFSTINRNAKAFALAIVGAECLLKMLPQDARICEIHSTQRTGRGMPQCRPRRATGARHAMQPLTGRYWLSGDFSVNYMFAAPPVPHEDEPVSRGALRSCSIWMGPSSTAPRPWSRRRQASHRPGHRRYLCRPTAHGWRRRPRGMLEVAFGIAPTIGLPGLKDEFLANF